MRLRDILRFSFENILRGGRKAVLSVLAIAVGIFSVCLISGAGTLASSEIEARITETGLGGITVFPSKTGESTISKAQLDALTHEIDGLRAVTPFTIQNAALIHRGKQRSVALIGVNPAISEVFTLRLLHGRLFSQADMAADSAYLLIDTRMADLLYARENVVGKSLQLNIEGRTLRAEIIGVIASQKEGLEGMLGVSLPNLIYVPYTLLDSIAGSTQTEQIALSCFAEADPETTAEAVVRYLHLSNHTKYKYENLNRYISSLYEIMDILQVFIEGVAGVSLLVGCLGIMNCMLYTIDARSCEIGICKALGEPRSSILLRYLTEAVIICMLGSLCGISATKIILWFLKGFTGIGLHIPVRTLIQSTGLAFVCGILSGILPALRASNLDPIEVIIRS